MLLDSMRMRASYTGYDRHDNKIVKNKYDSFRYALTTAHQAEWITFKDKKYRCLINPKKVDMDYDCKIISIDFDANMKVGDVFLWNRTNTYWIVFLEHLEEEAYFRGEIKQCDYDIDVNGNRHWVYLKGPDATDIEWFTKHSISINNPNYDISIYIQRTPETDEYFKRFKVIKFDGHNWRVAAVDRYSQTGILQVYLEEYFDNEMEDKMVPIAEAKDDDPTEIKGPKVVTAYDENVVYTVPKGFSGIFEVDDKTITLRQTSENSCEIDVLTSRVKSFNLYYKITRNNKYTVMETKIMVKPL